MSDDQKLPERGEADGPVSVNRFVFDGKDRIQVMATCDGIERSIVVTDYNAYRVFVSLAVVLNSRMLNALTKHLKGLKL